MKLGINVSPPWYAGQSWVFVDPLRQSGTGSGPWNLANKPAPLTIDGYPVLASGQSAFTRAYLNLNGHYPGGLYNCTWDGDGTISFGGDAAVPKAGGLQTCQVLIARPTNAGIICTITRSNPADPVRAIRMQPSGMTGRFRAEYLAGFSNFPGPIRFKDWQFTQSWPEFGWVRWCDRSSVEWCSHADGVTSVVDGFGNAVVDASVTPNRPYLRGAGVCLEYCVDLCNTLGRDGWFCIPHIATDEYIYGMASMIRDRLKPSLKCYIEWSNEIWNWNYAVSAFLTSIGIAAGITGTLHQHDYGEVASLAHAFGIWDSAWPDHTRCRRVLNEQLGGVVRFDQIMTALQTAGYTGIDGFAAAPYFQPSGTAVQGYSAATTAAQVLADSSVTIDTLLVPAMVQLGQYTSKWSSIFGRPIDLVAYECGPELNPLSHPWGPAYIAAGTDPGITPVMTQLFAAMQSAGFSLACYYTDFGLPNPSGTYGLRPYQDSPWTDPKPSAVAAWPNS